jgi:hypothetical protein
MDKEKILKSGKKLSFQYAEFECQLDLLALLSNEVNEAKVDLNNQETLGIALAKLIAKAMTDKEITNIFWRCANVCLYDGNRITQATFSDITNRKDYLEVKYWVLYYNLEIFFSSLFGESGALKNLGGEESIANLMQSLVQK